MPHDEVEADSWLPRISMGLTIAQLSARLRCAECGGPVTLVKPWRLEEVIGKPLGRGGNWSSKQSLISPLINICCGLCSCCPVVAAAFQPSSRLCSWQYRLPFRVR